MSKIQSQEMSFDNCVKVFDYHKEKYPTQFFDTDEFFFCLVRGHWLDSEGQKKRNDINILDDLWVAVNKSTKFYMAVKANVDPSFIFQNGKALARLSVNVFRAYRGDHKQQYPGFRPFPEGVRLPCTRNGVRSDCANTNGHGCKDIVDGIGYDTFSAGCYTQPITYFKNNFRPDCYQQIEKHHDTIDLKARNVRKLNAGFDKVGIKHFPVILMEKRPTADGNRIFSATGEVVPIY